MPTYKTCIETRHDNRDRLGQSEMGLAVYLLSRPRNCMTLLYSSFVEKSRTKLAFFMSTPYSFGYHSNRNMQLE